MFETWDVPKPQQRQSHIVLMIRIYSWPKSQVPLHDDLKCQVSDLDLCHSQSVENAVVLGIPHDVDHR